MFLSISQNAQEHTCARVDFFLNKIVGLRAATLFKKRLWYRCFPVSFAKFLRTSYFTEHLRGLLMLLDEIQITKKMKARESKERKFEKKKEK